MVVCILCLPGISQAVENPNVSTSFDSVTTVPSQGQQRRMLTSPNPLSAGSNDVITGNVGGMRYFRGVVPYGSPYYSGANLGDSGSSSISSFLRRSTDPVLSDRNPGQTRVFYEPRRVTSNFYVQNGRKTELSETLTASPIQRETYTRPTLTQLMSDESLQRPLSSNNQELDMILSRQQQLRENAEIPHDSLSEDTVAFKNFFEVVLTPEELRETLTEETFEKLEAELKQEQLRIQERKDSEAIDIDPQIILPDEMPPVEDFLKEEEPQSADDVRDSDGQQDSAESKDSQDDIHRQAEHIRGEHKTFSSLAQSKFSDYMRAAEEFMQQGKFYRAADAYSLAAVWMAEDARPYAGQSFSLFAAGEYMSSAYYLSRAIEIEPQLAAKKYDLIGLIGSRDIFENRLIEITTWQQRSESGELAFLMAYVLYHDGKPARAREAIAKAEERMPDSKAVSILKAVIIPENRNP
jgi:tetratricopeptide (TPR) repeat protein